MRNRKIQISRQLLCFIDYFTGILESTNIKKKRQIVGLGLAKTVCGHPKEVQLPRNKADDLGHFFFLRQLSRRQKTTPGRPWW